MKKFCVFLMLISCVLSVEGQEGLSVAVIPMAVIPVGSMSGDFGIGGGAELLLEYQMPFAEWLMVRAGAGYISTKNSVTGNNLSLIPMHADVGFLFPSTSRLKGILALGAGYGLGLYEGSSGGSMYFRGEAGLRFDINPAFTLGLAADYHMIVSRPDPLYQGIGIGLSLAYNAGKSTRQSRIEYRDIQLDPIFPVFYKYYDENPFGSVTIGNAEGSRIEDIRVSFFARRYMDEPKQSAVIPELKKGEARTLPLFALFNSDVLSITEGDKAAGRIIVDYIFQGEDRSSEMSVTLELHHRNAITWDDDRKAAAFVTANDPDVIRFSNAVAGTVREDGGRSVNLDLSIGMAMFQALGLQGLDYVVDPSSSYLELSENKYAVDYLKYPGETLYYGAGDCDDLSTCYNALLTSVGIDTAYITVPGHIFAAFALNMEPEEAERTFRNSADLIFRDERVWVPVETTMISDGFMEAWAAGAKQWRDYDERNQAGFLPVRESQAVYAPVGASNAGEVSIPSPSAILSEYSSENRRFIIQEIGERETDLKAAVNNSGNAPEAVNRLGLLYARYGLYEDARQYFAQVADSGYMPALVNLGNVMYLSAEYKDAADTYQKILDRSPDNPKALLGLAKSQYELENLGVVRQAYGQLADKYPDLAAKYTYLGSSDTYVSRAGALDYQEVVEWDEE